MWPAGKKFVNPPRYKELYSIFYIFMYVCMFGQRSYIFAFVLNSRLFLMPHQLMNQVCQVQYIAEHMLSRV